MNPVVICILKHLNTVYPPAWHLVFFRKSLNPTPFKVATRILCPPLLLLIQTEGWGRYLEPCSPLPLTAPGIPQNSQSASSQFSKGWFLSKREVLFVGTTPAGYKDVTAFQRERLCSQEPNFLSIPNNSPSSCFLTTSLTWGNGKVRKEKGKKGKGDGGSKDTV